MASLIVSLLATLSGLWSSLKRKPDPEPVPIPVDTKPAKDLLNPEDK